MNPDTPSTLAQHTHTHTLFVLHVFKYEKLLVSVFGENNAKKKTEIRYRRKEQVVKVQRERGKSEDKCRSAVLSVGVLCVLWEGRRQSSGVYISADSFCFSKRH